MREGAGESLRTRKLPGLVVCCGIIDLSSHVPSTGVPTSEMWRLDLGKLQWERMPSLTRGRYGHACCVVRGRVVVLGGYVAGPTGHLRTSQVSILGCDDSEETWKALPPLSCGPIAYCDALAIDESESELGQVLLFGPVSGSAPTVRSVDLSTGVCTLQPSSFNPPHPIVVARLPDGRIVRSNAAQQTVKVLGSPNDVDLPVTSVARRFCSGCVMSDGRFAVFGGMGNSGPLSSCEALTLAGSNARWEPLRSMHQARAGSACATIGWCVIVAGGDALTVEVYQEGLGRWRRLPCNLPDGAGKRWMGSAVL